MVLSQKETSAKKTVVTLGTLTEWASYLRCSDRKGEAYRQKDESVKWPPVTKMKKESNHTQKSCNACNEVGHKMTNCGKFLSMTPTEKKFCAKQMRMYCFCLQHKVDKRCLSQEQVSNMHFKASYATSRGRGFSDGESQCFEL